jgi:hypothetical protein
LESNLFGTQTVLQTYKINTKDKLQGCCLWKTYAILAKNSRKKELKFISFFGFLFSLCIFDTLIKEL